MEAQKAAQAKREADAKAAAAQKLADEAAAAKRAAKAPDKSKLLAFAASIRSLPVPKLSGDAGAALTKKITEQVTKFAAWIDSEAGKL